MPKPKTLREHLEDGTLGPLRTRAQVEREEELLARVAELEAENERLNSLVRTVSKGGIPDRWRTFEGVCDYLYINHEKRQE